MQEEIRSCGCDGNNNNCCSPCSSSNGGFLRGLFGGNNCGCGDNSILFFILIFLLLFTNCGCCDR